MTNIYSKEIGNGPHNEKQMCTCINTEGVMISLRPVFLFRTVISRCAAMISNGGQPGCKATGLK